MDIRNLLNYPGDITVTSFSTVDEIVAHIPSKEGQRQGVEAEKDDDSIEQTPMRLREDNPY